MTKDKKSHREQMKSFKQEQIHNLQLEMRQAYKEGNPINADDIMQKIKELRVCVQAKS